MPNSARYEDGNDNGEEKVHQDDVFATYVLGPTTNEEYPQLAHPGGAVHHVTLVMDLVFTQIEIYRQCPLEVEVEIDMWVWAGVWRKVRRRGKKV